ncbi:MAG: hypothetical protein IK022_04755 [Bacteroidales bacterium]|nr:hypothetical protein [Bacteroidales bacterium]
MKTLENLELNVPHMSAEDARGVFGGVYCDICGCAGYGCPHLSGGGGSSDPFSYPWTTDHNGNIWYGGWLVWDDHSHDEGGYYSDPDSGNGGQGSGISEPGGYLGL